MKSLTEFKEWFINLNESTLDNIVSYYDEKVFFKDPFNEFNGREKLKKLFLHMLIKVILLQAFWFSIVLYGKSFNQSVIFLITIFLVSSNYFIFKPNISPGRFFLF